MNETKNPGSDVLTALAEESQALGTVLRELGPADWGRLTNCPPWDLRELVVHIGASIDLDGPLPTAEPGAVRTSAAGYYRRPERNTRNYRQRTVDQTRSLATRVLASASWFEQVSRDTIAVLSADDLDRTVSVAGRAMRLRDWVSTRVIAVAAHGLDVALTVTRPAWTVPSVLRVVRPVFTDLLGQEPPAALDWSDQVFLAVATGRRGLSGRDRAVLGAAAERFPLLS